MIIKYWVGLIILFLTVAYSHVKIRDEYSYDWITCGEALFRANGSAAPRNKIEEAMWYECIVFGVKRWEK